MSTLQGWNPSCTYGEEGTWPVGGDTSTCATSTIALAFSTLDTTDLSEAELMLDED